MINKDTIDRIVETARVEEVIGDFITLKKRGVNLLGVCPFHNEKTPSFTVSPAKGIYKCFGCGKAGNAVNFMMEHEQMTYPDALRYLAKKYNIEIEEEQQTPEQLETQNEKESLYVVCSYAQKYFTEQLHTTDAGKSIGLSYFKERGFRLDIIEKFQLGYSPDEWAAFTDTAKKMGYKPEYLVKSGLTIQNEKSMFDRFSGRVIFPIHSVTGRVIGFGGRILKTDKKTAKYINSPETDIYHKSQVLYGIYFAKKNIIAEDNCFLVEGYTDVISLHQAGVQNVVASSGTSLTVEQIRLIKRYTPNITILYDGDPAGIKASFRGIDLILEEGMNVKVLLFPDGEDPDSYSKKVSSEDLKSFIKINSRDFISFKTALLYEGVKTDPIKKSELIKDIVDSIALIPDAISRSLYVKECSRLLVIEEQVLLQELNKIRKKRANDNIQSSENTTDSSNIIDPGNLVSDETIKATTDLLLYDAEPQERDIVRLLLNYSAKKINVETEDDQGNKVNIEATVKEVILHELEQDAIFLENPLYNKLINEFKSTTELELNANYFIHHADKDISNLAIHIISTPYSISINWEKHGIIVQTEENLLKKAIYNAVYSLKSKRVMKMLAENQQKMQETKNEEELIGLLEHQKQLMEAKKFFNSLLGRIIIK